MFVYFAYYINYILYKSSRTEIRKKILEIKGKPGNHGIEFRLGLL